MDFLLMPLLFEGKLVYLPGRDLMIGMQLESWASTALMILPATNREHSDSFVSSAVLQL